MVFRTRPAPRRRFRSFSGGIVLRTLATRFPAPTPPAVPCSCATRSLGLPGRTSHGAAERRCQPGLPKTGDQATGRPTTPSSGKLERHFEHGAMESDLLEHLLRGGILPSAPEHAPRRTQSAELLAGGTYQGLTYTAAAPARNYPDLVQRAMPV